MKTQAELIEEIAWRRRPREVIFEELRAFESVSDIYILPLSAVTEIINLRIAGKISEKEVVEWASFFECRDEVDYHAEERDRISEAIFLLANPEINYPLTEENLRMILGKCESHEN